jgi:hypothetical protein
MSRSLMLKSWPEDAFVQFARADFEGEVSHFTANSVAVVRGSLRLAPSKG